MNALHKIVYSILLLLSIAGVVLMSATLLQVLAIDFVVLQGLENFITTGPRWQIVTLVILALSLVLLLLVLFWRVWRSAQKSYKVFGDGTKNAYITRQSVESLAQNTIATIDGVLANRCVSGTSSGGVKLQCQITVQHGELVPDLVTKIQESVKQQLERQLGIKIVKITTNVRYKV